MAGPLDAVQPVDGRGGTVLADGVALDGETLADVGARAGPGALLLGGAQAAHGVRDEQGGPACRLHLADPVGSPHSERGGVDDEAVADVGGQDSFVRLVDLVGGDDLDLGAEAVLGAEVEHLLG